MRINNLKEYFTAIEKAAFFLDNGFGGSFEKEKYCRELLNAIKEYDEKASIQLINYQVVSKSA